jgi:Zn-dependent M28 family amino/carboxypeptidase
LENSQIVFIRCSSKTTIVSGRAKSVVATIQGQSDDYVIVCAHGDSDAGGPGADDNASGVSCVLELARILQSMVKTKALPVPKYTIKFIAWGSEYASTEQYVKGHAGALNRIRAVINYDELGAGTPRSCLYFEGNNVPQNYELLKMFERVGDEYAAKRGFWNEATTNPTQDGTDAYVFYPDYLKKLDLPPATIPSITVFTAAWNETKTMAQTAGWQSKAWKGNPDSVIISYSPYYHSSLDIPVLTTDKEPQKMMWGVRSVGIVLLRWLWN